AAADASWEVARIAREKIGLPERKCEQRIKVLADLERRRTRAAETTAAKPATALGHSLGLEAGFPYYQALDIAQTRAIKRRDNARRQIARCRDGLGGKARALSDKFIAEVALAERYGVAHSLDAEIDDTAGETMEAPLPFAPAGEAREDTPPLRASDEAAEAAPAVASSAGAELHPRSLPGARRPKLPLQSLRQMGVRKLRPPSLRRAKLRKLHPRKLHARSLRRMGLLNLRPRAPPRAPSTWTRRPSRSTGPA